MNGLVSFCFRAAIIATFPFAAFQAHSLPVPSDFGEVSAAGELALRLERNYNRLEEGKYRPDRIHLSEAESGGWPGDTEGRTMLALVLEARATGREPKYLGEMLKRLPGWLNEKGYMGPVRNDCIDEQQLSGNGWMLRALCEYVQWRDSPQLRERIRTLVRNLYLPWKGSYADYPIDPSVRVKDVGAASGNVVSTGGKWRLSSDVGCVFIGLDGVVQAFVVLGDESFRPVIEEMIGRFLAMDLLAIRAQAHASLTALRALVRYADATGKDGLLREVERRFELYRTLGMTATFANFNWFGRPDTWTEPCAIVDSYLLAVELWRHTVKREYLDIATHIYFNALCRAQRANGGFGIENCPDASKGPEVLSVKTPEAHWCCTMRGGEGLAMASRFSLFKDREGVWLPFYRNLRATVKLPQGRLQFEERCSEPDGKKVEVWIGECPAEAVRIRLFRPIWADKISVSIGGERVVWAEDGGFLVLSRAFAKGDRIVLSFDGVRRSESCGAKWRLFDGYLQLGRPANSNSVDVLRPVYHLMDPSIFEPGSGSLKVLFEKVP